MPLYLLIQRPENLIPSSTDSVLSHLTNIDFVGVSKRAKLEWLWLNTRHFHLWAVLLSQNIFIYVPVIIDVSRAYK